FFFQAEDGIRDKLVTGVQTCALPILEEADRLEAAIAPDDVPEIAEDLEAFEGQLRLGLVGVVHAHERARLSGGAGAEVSALEQEDVLNSPGCKVKSGAGSVDATADDDYVCPRHEAPVLLPPVGGLLD